MERYEGVNYLCLWPYSLQLWTLQPRPLEGQFALHCVSMVTTLSTWTCIHKMYTGCMNRSTSELHVNSRLGRWTVTTVEIWLIHCHVRNSSSNVGLIHALEGTKLYTSPGTSPTLNFQYPYSVPSREAKMLATVHLHPHSVLYSGSIDRPHLHPFTPTLWLSKQPIQRIT